MPLGMLPAAVVDILIVLAWCAWGGAIAWLLLERPSSAAIVSASFPVGSGLFTFVLFLLSLAGMRLTALSLLAVYLAGSVVLAGMVAIVARRRQLTPTGARTGLAPGIWALVGVLVVISVGVSVGRAYSQWDAAATWSVKGYGIFLEETVLAGERWGAWGLAYPLNLPLQIGTFAALTGDVLPGSKLIFPAYYASLLLAAADFWRRHGVSPAMTFGGVVLLATTPLVFLHGTLGYANLPAAGYLVAGMMLGIDAIEARGAGWLAASGLMLGLALWTRSEAVLFVAAIVFALLLSARLLRRPVGRVWLWLAPIAVIGGVWYLFSWQHVSGSGFGQAVRGFVPQFLAGEFRLFQLYLIPRLLLDRMLDPRLWGLYLPITALLLAIGLPGLKRRGWSQLAAGLSALALSSVVVGIFYVRAFTRTDDFIGLLTRSFDRALLPAALSVVVFALLLFARGPEEQAAEAAGGRAAAEGQR